MYTVDYRSNGNLSAHTQSRSIYGSAHTVIACGIQGRVKLLSAAVQRFLAALPFSLTEISEVSA